MTMETEQSNSVVLIEGYSDDANAGRLQLPFTKHQFADFVSSLLGSPQSIDQRIFGSFCLEADDVRQAHILLEQRVSQQNDGALIRFHAQLELADKTTVNMNSMESLLSYRSIKDVETVRLLLVWDYMILFPKKANPEKQTIEVSIRTSSKKRNLQQEEDVAVLVGRVRMIRLFPAITITVRYTERTWGEDISSLLTSHFNSKVGRLPKFKQFLSRFSVVGGVVTGALVYASIIVSIFRATLALAELNAERATDVLDAAPDGDAQMRAGIDLLIQLQAEGVWHQHFMLVGIVLILGIPIAILFGAWVGTAMDPGDQEPQYILFPHAPADARKHYERYIANNVRPFIIALVVSFLVGIISNFASAFLIKLV